MSTENMDLLLTQSQEFALLNQLSDQHVGTLLTLFENPDEQQKQQEFICRQPINMFQTDQYHSLVEQSQFQNVMQYTDVVPPVLQPPVIPAIICNEDYEGPFKFEVYVDPNAAKTPWVYSSVLNKLFINISNPFPVDFKWETKIKNMYVRAMPLFTLSQHSQELVSRCIPHAMASNETNRDVPKDIWAHVIRCQSSSAEYYGNIQDKIHLSVLARLGEPQTGIDTVRLMYTFVCQNSCPTGMNRKPIEVVFTLEDELGKVFGRRKLNVRICSCPKRDKEKEENEYLNEANGAPQGKKRKVGKTEKKSIISPALDTKEYTLEIRICGKRNSQSLIKMAHDMMAGELVRHGPNRQVQACLDHLGKQLKELE